MVSPAGTALPPAGASGWGGLIGREGARREGASAAPQATLSLVKYSGGRCPLFPRGRVGSQPCPERVSLRRCHRLPAGAIMDAPFGGKWTAGEGLPSSRPTSPWGCAGCRGPQVAKGRRITGSSLPTPREGSRVLFILPNISGMPPGDRGSWPPARAGGLPGAWWGAAGKMLPRACPGGLGRLLPGPGEELGMWGLSQGAGSQPGPVDGAG